MALTPVPAVFSNKPSLTKAPPLENGKPASALMFHVPVVAAVVIVAPPEMEKLSVCKTVPLSSQVVVPSMVPAATMTVPVVNRVP